jgi:DNA-binding MarR family transcriptional regulator
MDAATTANGSVDCWMFAWCALTQRSRRWQAELDELLRPRSLTSPDLLVLWRVGNEPLPGIAQVDLAREIGFSPAQVCGVVEKLVDRAWLRAARMEGDRRRLYCSLTAEGSEQLRQIFHCLQPLAEQWLHEPPPWTIPMVFSKRGAAA